MRRFWLGLFLGVLLGVLTAAALRHYLRSREPGPPPPALTVNGEEVSLETLKSEALFINSNFVLNNLIQRKLVQQEAAHQKLRLSQADLEALQKIKDGPNAEAARAQAEAAMFAQQMLLKGVSEARIREVYELYKNELKQYELFVIVLVTRKSGQELQRSLEDGSNFDTLVTNFSIDPSRAQGGRLGWLTMPQIRQTLGQEAADEVARLKSNQVGKVIYTPFGLTVLKVGQIKSEYKDLKPQATSLIAESRRAELMYRLYSAAKIQSPLLEKAPDPLPRDQSGIKPDSDSLPVPDSGVGEMPTPEAGQ